MSTTLSGSTNRRQLLLVTATACGMWPHAAAQLSGNPQAMRAAVTAFTGGRTPRDGRVQIDISPLVENGNTVPIALSVESAMTASDHVRRIAVFTERNPQPDVAVFNLSLLSGKAEVATRIRLATSQRIVALAEFHDGSFWQRQVDVVVTLAACVEGG